MDIKSNTDYFKSGGIKRIISDISEFIFVSMPAKRADAIFLPGGSHPALPEYAARLYLNGMAKLVVPAGGISIKHDKWPGVRQRADIYNGDYSSDCEFYIDVLTKNGVPESAILGEDKSRYTRDNAFFSRKACDEHNIKISSAIIVCKSFHARRCLMLYQLAFEDAELTVCPVDCFGIAKESWYLSQYGIERVLGELTRCGSQLEELKKHVEH